MEERWWYLSVTALLLLVIMWMGACFTGCNDHYSDGAWVGVVTKLSYKGVIWKSWEGELVSVGQRQVSTKEGTSSTANVMEFNVDPSVVEKVKLAMEVGKPVTLTYHQWLIAPVRISGDHVVFAVEEAK